jgi:lipid-A-disaccharide synthase
MRYYLIAGEASGDLQGAALIEALKQHDPQAEFRFWGGDLMAKASGLLPVVHQKERAFMGLWEVISHLGTIRKHLKLCKQDIQAWKPDVVIPVDHPGFNMRMAAFARKRGFKVVYFIAPKAWAWKKRRAYALAKQTDLVLSILPFEPAFFAPYGVNVLYIGNPLWDKINAFKRSDSFLEEHKLHKPMIVLLPGSRKQEIGRILPDMLAAAARFNGYEVAVACAPDFPPEYYQSMLPEQSAVRLISNATYQLLAHADAALVASGTATLEAALLNCPQVVCYKTSTLTYRVARLLLRIKFISLVNLIMGREVVPERIQEGMKPEIMEQDLKDILYGTERNRMLSAYRELRNLMGEVGAGNRAATEILQLLQQK